MCDPMVTALASDQRLKEVLAFVADGWTDDRIARHLEVSATTVKRDIRRAAAALGVEARPTLAVAAVRLGLVPDPPAVSKAVRCACSSESK